MEAKGKIWIEINNETFIGGGKAILLQKTADLGSLRKAANELNISYRQAWYSLNQTNNAATTPLIILKRGGKQGGIAEITKFGKEMIERYKILEENFDDFLKTQTASLNKI